MVPASSRCFRQDEQAVADDSRRRTSRHLRAQCAIRALPRRNSRFLRVFFGEEDVRCIAGPQPDRSSNRRAGTSRLISSFGGGGRSPAGLVHPVEGVPQFA